MKSIEKRSRRKRIGSRNILRKKRREIELEREVKEQIKIEINNIIEENV